MKRSRRRTAAPLASMYSPRRVSVEGPPTPPTPPTPPAPATDDDSNASDAEAIPTSRAFASPFAVPASTALQRERRTWRARDVPPPTPRSWTPRRLAKPAPPDPPPPVGHVDLELARTRTGLTCQWSRQPDPPPPPAPPPPPIASPEVTARRDVNRRRRGARAATEEERDRARAQRVLERAAARRYKMNAHNEAVRAENARQALLAEHARARVFIEERPHVFEGKGRLVHAARVLPRPQVDDLAALPPLPPKRPPRIETPEDDDDFGGLLANETPEPDVAPAEAAAPASCPEAVDSAVVSFDAAPTSPTGYSDDAEDFEDEDELAAGTPVEARFGGEEDWYPGTVQARNADGSYAVLYDDGDAEASVAPDHVRPRP